MVSNGTAHLKEPGACTEGERREFERLVRQGFKVVTEPLDARICGAKWLAFFYPAGATLAAIAALKAPKERIRQAIFSKAEAGFSSAEYEHELGWVFVDPEHRGKRIAEGLCRELLARMPTSAVYAATRTDNTPMIRILLALGFERVGKPYPRRDEQLVLFVRPRPDRVAPIAGV